MAKKISEFDPAVTLGDADILPVVQGTSVRKSARTTLAAIANFVLGKLSFASYAQATAGQANNVVTSPLSIRQFCEGKGLGGTYLPGAGDLNDVVTSGPFSWDASSPNSPVAGSYGRGLSLPSSTGYVTQIAVVNGTFQVFIRYQNGGTWDAQWTLIARPVV